METVEREFTITNRHGLHARPAGKLVELAGRYAAEVWIARAGEEVKAESILDVLTLACGKGTRITVRVTGLEAGEVMAAIAELIENRFGEE